MYIHQLEVNNFRSLRDVTIGNLSAMVILYGKNNTGKSNVLAFLEHLFKQKSTLNITETSGEDLVQKASGFWRGELEGFSDNYYLNSEKSITFSVTIRFDRAEILNIPDLPVAFLSQLRAERQYDLLKLEGEIAPSEEGRARVQLFKAHFDQKGFYDAELSDTDRYLKSFKLKPADAQLVFDGVMGLLDDAFLMIPATRFLKREMELGRDPVRLESETFKNWLFQLSINRGNESVFREISKQFSDEPFQFGRLSIARIGDNDIEVFVEDVKTGFKLPIGRKGSGVQQILMILAYIANSKSPMIGIEELEINLSPEAQGSIFQSLHTLLYTAGSPVKQIFLTTHIPYIGKRNEAQRRGVWMENGETKIAKPTVAKINDFFAPPIRGLGR